MTEPLEKIAIEGEAHTEQPQKYVPKGDLDVDGIALSGKVAVGLLILYAIGMGAIKFKKYLGNTFDRYANNKQD